MPLKQGLPSVFVALVIALASAGVLAVTIYQDHAILTASPAQSAALTPASGSSESAPEQLSSGNIATLFGTVSQEAAPRAQPEKLPETRLNLTLAGTFTHAEDARASALIAEAGQSTQRYFVGDSVPGNAELVAVNAGNVVLRRNGQDEVLKLPILKQRQTDDSAARPPHRRQQATTYEMNPRTGPANPEQDAQVRQAQLKDRLSRLRARLQEEE